MLDLLESELALELEALEIEALESAAPLTLDELTQWEGKEQ